MIKKFELIEKIITESAQSRQAQNAFKQHYDGISSKKFSNKGKITDNGLNRQSKFVDKNSVKAIQYHVQHPNSTSVDIQSVGNNVFRVKTQKTGYTASKDRFKAKMKTHTPTVYATPDAIKTGVGRGFGYTKGAMGRHKTGLLTMPIVGSAIGALSWKNKANAWKTDTPIGKTQNITNKIQQLSKDLQIQGNSPDTKRAAHQIANIAKYIKTNTSGEIASMKDWTRGIGDVGVGAGVGAGLGVAGVIAKKYYDKRKMT